MNPLIPLFVVTPLAGAFLIMIIGRFIKEFNKYFTSVILLFLACISFYFLFTYRRKYICIQSWRMGTNKQDPNWYLYGNGWIYSN